jgi:cytochrome c oxidase cbb3-type subunit I/II
MTARFVALVAGVLFFFLAVFTQGILTLLEPSARTTDVTAVVRTDLGQLKWMATEATDYTPLQQRGRRVYLSEGCWAFWARWRAHWDKSCARGRERRSCC